MWFDFLFEVWYRYSKTCLHSIFLWIELTEGERIEGYSTQKLFFFICVWLWIYRMYTYDLHWCSTTTRNSRNAFFQADRLWSKRETELFFSEQLIVQRKNDLLLVVAPFQIFICCFNENEMYARQFWNLCRIEYNKKINLVEVLPFKLV
jgi:hypothetical protein